MLDSLRTPFAVAGRFLLALMFVMAGFSKITGFAGTVGYMASKGMPAAEVLAALTIVLEIGGGLALLFGWQARWAALALALFTLLASVIFHNFWALPEAQKMMQQLMFMKNLAIVGGLFMVVALGAGPASLDARNDLVPARA